MTVNPQPLKLTASHSDSSKMSCGEHFQSFCEVTYLQLKHIQEAYQHNNIKKKKRNTEDRQSELFSWNQHKSHTKRKCCLISTKKIITNLNVSMLNEN